MKFWEDFVFVFGWTKRCAVKPGRVVEMFILNAVVEDFEIFTIDAVVWSRTFASLTFFVAMFTDFSGLVGKLVLSAAVFTLFSFAVSCTFGTNTFMKTVASTFGAAWMAHAANCFSS